MRTNVHIPVWGVYVFTGLLLAIVFAVMSFVIADYAADQAVDTSRRAAVAGCDRNQVPRGYLQITAADGGEMASNYFRIVNCGETFAADNAGTTVFLSRPLEACFLRLLREEGFGRNAENVTTDPQRLHVEYNCT